MIISLNGRIIVKNQIIYKMCFIYILFIMTLSCSSHIEQINNENTEKVHTETLIEKSLRITEQSDIIIVPNHKTATIYCKVDSVNKGFVTYQWYKCDDISKTNSELIKDATSNFYKTTLFINKEIRYYYCEVKDDVDKIESKVIIVAYTGLPILKIETPDCIEIASKDIWVENSKLSLIDYEHDDWTISEPISTSIRGRGNSTWKLPKKPYAIKLNKKKSILGMPENKRWVLIANYLDNSFIRNELAFYLSELFELDYTVRGKYVDLILNGEYKGLYWLGEAIKTDVNRVNINDGLKTMSENDDKDYLIEMDVHFDEPIKFKSSICNLPYMIKNDDYMIDEDNNMTSGGQFRLERLKTKINLLEGLLYPDFSEGMKTSDCMPPNEEYSKIIDVDSWVKFWLINEIMDNIELGHPKSCYYTFDSENNIFKAGPVWDFDYGLLQQTTSCKLKNTIYYDALFKSPLFINRVKIIWNEYYGKIHIVQKVESLRTQLKYSSELDGYIWGINHNPTGSICNNFDEYVNEVRNFLLTKLDVVNTDISKM